MNIDALERVADSCWRYPVGDARRVPVVIYADEPLVRDMDRKVLEQACNVATLPGIVGASYVMPDGHWGHGFPIGGVAAFDPTAGGVVSAGGVGFDISCGVRCLTMGVEAARVRAVQPALADGLVRRIPAGVGSTGRISLDADELDEMLAGGARWAVDRGWGQRDDLARIEERGCASGAKCEYVSERARRRQRDEMGTLGSGNHYLEIQKVAEVFEPDAARAFGLEVDHAVVSIHCGSRGLGHQIGTDYLRDMARTAGAHDLRLPDRELACAPLESDLGVRYLGAMRAAVNCALANRQIITELARAAIADALPDADLRLVYDVSHNTCREELHLVDGSLRRVFVHRKGATRSFGPGNEELDESLRGVGQPVFIGGTMGTESYVLVGTNDSMGMSFGSACHGAGRRMSRNMARRAWRGHRVLEQLEQRGIIVRAAGMRGVAEEAPGAYNDVSAVVDVATRVGLARKVARLEPLICIKG